MITSILKIPQISLALSTLPGGKSDDKNSTRGNAANLTCNWFIRSDYHWLSIDRIYRLISMHHLGQRCAAYRVFLSNEIWSQKKWMKQKKIPLFYSEIRAKNPNVEFLCVTEICPKSKFHVQFWRKSTIYLGFTRVKNRAISANVTSRKLD